MITAMKQVTMMTSVVNSALIDQNVVAIQEIHMDKTMIEVINGYTGNHLCTYFSSVVPRVGDRISLPSLSPSMFEVCDCTHMLMETSQDNVHGLSGVAIYVKYA